jgi:hypothetical protein
MIGARDQRKENNIYHINILRRFRHDLTPLPPDGYSSLVSRPQWIDVKTHWSFGGWGHQWMVPIGRSDEKWLCESPLRSACARVRHPGEQFFAAAKYEALIETLVLQESPNSLSPQMLIQPVDTYGCSWPFHRSAFWVQAYVLFLGLASLPQVTGFALAIVGWVDAVSYLRYQLSPWTVKMFRKYTETKSKKETVAREPYLQNLTDNARAGIGLSAPVGPMDD